VEDGRYKSTGHEEINEGRAEQLRRAHRVGGHIGCRPQEKISPDYTRTKKKYARTPCPVERQKGAEEDTE
jgi:hypothetical protein